ncbi:MAG TPA: HAD-IA family hydrolase [Flavobacteriales bacterium]|nr:HAD-IA family hydrolase [Flavobacteriales bacterium]
MNRYQQNIEILCNEHRIDLSELADKLRCDISDIFRPKPDTLISLSDYFNVTIDSLIKAPLMKVSQIREYPIKMLVMDVDGVLTKGEITYTENGDEIKSFNVKDGYAIKQLKKNGKFIIGIISHSVHVNILTKRKTILDLDFAEISSEPKDETLKRKCKEYKIETKDVMYIGDDLNDIAVMKLCGLIACPNDAVDEVKRIAHVILKAKGGEGCLRELIDGYLK